MQSDNMYANIRLYIVQSTYKQWSWPSEAYRTCSSLSETVFGLFIMIITNNMSFELTSTVKREFPSSFDISTQNGPSWSFDLKDIALSVILNLDVIICCKWIQWEFQGIYYHLQGKHGYCSHQKLS